jgi:hypothetical protein
MDQKNTAELLAHYTSGYPYLAEDCPSPAIFDVVDPDHAAKVFAAKTEKREAYIASYVALHNCDRFVAAITYDASVSPLTTNRKQLEELNIMVPSPSMIEKRNDDWCTVRLWNIIYGLARLGIFLTNTDTYTDRELLLRLVNRVLQDKIHDLPPNPDMSEFIDLNCDGTPITTRLLPMPDRNKNFSGGGSGELLKIQECNVDAFVAQLNGLFPPADNN